MKSTAIDARRARPRGQGLFGALWELLRTPVAPGYRGHFAFGWLMVLLFIAQLATGILLSFYYEPDPASAASSVRYIMRDVSNGWLVRGLHHWSSTAIIALALLQLVRVLVTRAYRNGGAWSWYLGCVLLGLVFLLGFTGELLIWDDHAYWRAVLVLERIEQLPLVGPSVAAVLRGGSDVAGHTLSRAYVLHALLLPGLSMGAVVLNLWMLARRRRAGGPSR